jgi:hypothetical protein
MGNTDYPRLVCVLTSISRFILQNNLWGEEAATSGKIYSGFVVVSCTVINGG